MSKTIHFYNCFITHNGNRTTINLSDFLDAVYLKDPNDKFRNLRAGEMSLPDMIEPDPNDVNTYQNRSVGVAKYRDKKPYTGQKRTDQANIITQDVLELTSMTAIPNEYLLIIEYNHYGARPSHIQSYLDSFLPKGEGDRWEVEFIPIEPERGIGDVLGSNDIRYIEFKLNLQVPMPGVEAINADVSLIGDVLGLARSAREGFGANTATVCFGNGRNRQETINAEQLIELIRVLDLDSDAFESVKVRYKSPTTRNVEFIDLKNAGILKRVIMEEEIGDGWELISEHINRDYINNRPGSGYYVRYIDNIIAADLPPLIEYDSEEEE